MGQLNLLLVTTELRDLIKIVEDLNVSRDYSELLNQSELLLIKLLTLHL